MASTQDQSAPVVCADCRRSFRWKPELAGERVKCKCGGRIRFPSQAPAPPRPTQASRAKAAPVNAASSDDFNPFDDVLDQLAASADAAPGEPVAAVGGKKQAAGPGLSRCPVCRHDVPGNAVMCPNCDSALTGSAGQVKPPRGKSLPKPPAGRVKVGTVTTFSSGTKVAGAGLLIHGGGYVVAIFGALIAVFFVIAASISRSANDTGSAMAAGALVAAAAVPLLFAGIGMLGVFVGPLMALATPSAAGRDTLIGAMVCFLVSAGAPFVAIVLPLDEAPLLIAVPVAVSIIASLIATAFVMMFLSQFAAYIEDERSEARADRMLGLFKFVIGVYILMFLVVFIPFIGPIIAAIGMVVINICFLIIACSYVYVCLSVGWKTVRA